jgi:outer membrane immunogenic protein
MKKLSLASVAMVALSAGGSALAADMPVKARPLPPPAVYSWTGFYVGANIGYSWGRSSNDWNFYAPNSNILNPLSTTCTSAGGGALCAAGSDSNKLNGVIGGLQAGYNWQTGQFLVGVETDIQASGQKGDGIFSTGFPVGSRFPPALVEATYTQKLQWLGTARGRIGFATDRTLLYVTGGLAYGRVAINGSATVTGTDDAPGLPPNTTPCDDPIEIGFGRCLFASWSNGVTKVGWSLGVGAEGAIADNWSWKIEYLHVDLGRVTTNFATGPGCYGNGGAGGLICFLIGSGSGTISSRITDDIVRVGLNYRFGWGKAPVAVMAKY